MELKEEWQKVHQPYELTYHRDQGVNWCSDEKQFQDFWNEIKNWIKPKGIILDIGCGPRPPFQGFAIEPLADEYRKITPPEWWENVIYSNQPAEEFIKEFKDKFNRVIIWNCLDHTYNWRQILDNAVKYVKKTGRVIIATDHREPHIGHPGFKKEELLEEINKRFEIVEQKENFKERQLCLILKLKK